MFLSTTLFLLLECNNLAWLEISILMKELNKIACNITLHLPKEETADAERAEDGFEPHTLGD